MWYGMYNGGSVVDQLIDSVLSSGSFPLPRQAHSALKQQIAGIQERVKR